MDESTSALDIANEALLYKLLRKRGITFCSVGHRPSLAEFHEQASHPQQYVPVLATDSSSAETQPPSLMP